MLNWQRVRQPFLIIVGSSLSGSIVTIIVIIVGLLPVCQHPVEQGGEDLPLHLHVPLPLQALRLVLGMECQLLISIYEKTTLTT